MCILYNYEIAKIMQSHLEAVYGELKPNFDFQITCIKFVKLLIWYSGKQQKISEIWFLYELNHKCYMQMLCDCELLN